MLKLCNDQNCRISIDIFISALCYACPPINRAPESAAR